MTKPLSFFYAAVGARLTSHHLNVDEATLFRDAHVDLPQPVQYAWPHPTRPLLYVVSSNGLPGNVGASASTQSGSEHCASLLEIDCETGALTPVHDPVALPSRPIHCCLDAQASALLVAYNRPSGLTVHPLGDDGRIGGALEQQSGLDFGVYGHQVMATPQGKRVILVARGNDAADGHGEDPGALKAFRLLDGRLTFEDSVTPGNEGGYGFGPRHLDFHPNGRWAYVSVERQNALQVYDLDAQGALSPDARQTLSSLSAEGLDPVRQMACAVRVHPNGKTVYQVNRSDGRRRANGWSVGGHGEDSLAIYDIGADGRVTVRCHEPLPAVHIRTFSIDPSGRLLIAASIEPVPVPAHEGGVRMIPARLMVYRIRPDGGVSFERSYDVDTRDSLLFWTGIVGVAP